MNIEPPYEKPSLAGRPFLWLGVVLVALLTLSAAVSWLLTSRWGTPPRHLETIAPPQTDPHWNNEAAQLQTHPPLDLQHLRDEQEATLHQTAWSDPAHHFARIPIEEAMRLVVTPHSP